MQNEFSIWNKVKDYFEVPEKTFLHKVYGRSFSRNRSSGYEMKLEIN